MAITESAKDELEEIKKLKRDRFLYLFECGMDVYDIIFIRSELYAICSQLSGIADDDEFMQQRYESALHAFKVFDAYSDEYCTN